MPSIYRKIVCVLLLTIFVSSCGWHLRGSIPLPDHLQSIYIESRANSQDLAEDIDRLLKANGITPQESASQAEIVISLLDFSESSRVNSVNSNTIVREYELITRAEYEIKNGGGEILLEPTESSLSRPYTFNQNAVVSASEEEEIIQRELRLELAQQIVRRLRFLDTKPL